MLIDGTYASYLLLEMPKIGFILYSLNFISIKFINYFQYDYLDNAALKEQLKTDFKKC